MGNYGTLQENYARAMSYHGFGRALYEPQHEANLRVGSVGYIDSSGQWTPLVNVIDGKSTENRGLESVVPRRAQSCKCFWGPKVANRVTYKAANVDGSLSVTEFGIPVNASTSYNNSSSESFGAVLLTDGEVELDKLYDQAKYETWGKGNAGKIFTIWPDTREHGFFVVTSTYSAPFVALNAWSDPSRSLKVSFKTDAAEIGKIGTAYERSFSTHGEGWAWYGEEGQRVIVFFGGLYFQPRWLPIKGHETKAIPQEKWGNFRSGKQASLSNVRIDLGDDQCEITCELIGSPDESDLPNQGEDEEF